MKTTKSITLALAAMLALGASAFADQPSAQKANTSKTKISATQKTQKTTAPKTTAKTWDSQPMPLRAVGMPVVFLERAGHSLIRSPQIASETFSGKRDLVSKRGLMTERDMKKGTPKVSSTQKHSSANNRG